MYKLIATILVSFGALQAVQAADQSCEDQAVAKHLAGAAKNSFVKKCERTSQAAAAKEQCNSQADEKKLHGAARTSFVNKCVRTASAPN
ncbi:MAG TPA: PsiF family protein [Steroidobacteraceae bacterium]|nr:PsiF family protein [Steroidobacteraceae bacterium]